VLPKSVSVLVITKKIKRTSFKSTLIASSLAACAAVGVLPPKRKIAISAPFAFSQRRDRASSTRAFWEGSVTHLQKQEYNDIDSG